jgi:hypothetical protein
MGASAATVAAVWETEAEVEVEVEVEREGDREVTC